MTMLQFSGIFINLSVRHNTRLPLWCATQTVTAYSTISNPQVEQVDQKSKISSDENKKKIPSETNKRKTFEKKNVKIADLNVSKYFTNIEESEVEKLLSTINMSSLNSEFSLKIISQLSTLVKSGKAKVADFESDTRYKSLCQYLFDNSSQEVKNSDIQLKTQKFRNKNLGFLFDINEIHKMIEKPDLSMQESVQILTKLGLFKSRIMPVLQALTERIVNSNESMHIKCASDIMYNMSILNFYDEALMNKILPTLIEKIPKIRGQNSAVIGSILKSIGLLRYRNEELLMTLTTWILNNHAGIKPQYICSFLVTLAVVGFTPTTNLQKFQAFTSQLTEIEMSGASEWLDVVWALVVLNQAQEAQVMSVLNPEFLGKLAVVTTITESKKRKILNINACAKLLFKKNQDQLLNSKSLIYEVTLEKNRDQQEFVKRIVTALFAFLPSDGCLKMDVNTNMGFSIDAEFYVDENSKPILISQIASTEKKSLKLAVQSLTYYDFCRGDEKVIGQIQFQNSLLNLLGYKVIPISYKNFTFDQKVLNHVKYLRTLINDVVKKNFPN